MKNLFPFCIGFSLCAVMFLFASFSSSLEPAEPQTHKRMLPFEQLSAGGGTAGQFGKVVGQIYVPEYALGACTYEEHWFVGKDYVYPGANNPVELTITPLPNLQYNSVKEFKEKMKKVFPEGHYIKVMAYEEIPGCPSL